MLIADIEVIWNDKYKVHMAKCECFPKVIFYNRDYGAAYEAFETWIYNTFPDDDIECYEYIEEHDIQYPDDYAWGEEDL